MASESIEILIEAENKASGTLKTVGNDVAVLGTKVKATGQQVKASTELAGSFARAFGSSAIGAFASELAGLTEKVSAFSEISKQGAAGALALKVGIAGAVAVATFKIGEQIGNWVFETERWKKELEAAAKAADKAYATIEKNRAKRFAEAREDISVERGDGKEKATQSQIDKLQRESAGMQTRLDMARKEVAERKAANESAWIKGNTAEELKVAEQQLAALEKSKQAIDTERQALADSISERAKSIEAKKQENALADKSDAFLKSLEEENAMLRANKEEQAKIEAERNVVASDRGRAEILLKERDALREQAEEKKRIAALEDRELDRLELKRVELEQGKEAAKAYALQMEGLSEEMARSIAARESALDAIRNSRPDKNNGTAVQGRLLTQGPTANPVVELLKKLIAIAERGSQDVSKALRESAKDEPVVIKTVTVP